MKTYSEKEIEEYVSGVLKSMPWPNGMPPATQKNSARFILSHVLKSEGVVLYDNNEMRNSRGHVIGIFGSAEWEEEIIKWMYKPVGGTHYIVSRLKVKK